MDAQENVDILDTHGKKTGKVRLKSDAHKLGLWHTGAHVWVYNSKGEVLLQKRSMEKENWPGRWDSSAAGHVSAGEKPLNAIVRELREELGIRTNAHDLRRAFIVKEKNDYSATYHNREFDHIYILRLDIPLKKLKLQKEEVSGAKFLSIKEFKKELKGKVTGKKYVPHKYYPRIIAAIEKD